MARKQKYLTGFGIPQGFDVFGPVVFLLHWSNEYTTSVTFADETTERSWHMNSRILQKKIN